MSVFKKATKAKKKLRLALCGVSGSGKTYSALAIATGIGGRIFVIDTEHESATLYSDVFEFEHCGLPTNDPRMYVDYIHLAEQEGAEIIVIDSFSHAWMGKGGALEMVDNIAKSDQRGNSFGAWRSVTPLHNALVDAVLSSPCHIIVTMRSKQDYSLEKDSSTGRNAVRKLGLAPIQREGVEYEFDVTGDMNMQNELVISKTRYSKLAGQVFSRPGKALGKELRDWLSDGADAPQVAPAGLPAPLVDEVYGLFVALALNPQQITGSLTKRGVSRVEALTVDQAQEMIGAMKERLAKLTPAPAPAPEPETKVAPEPTFADLVDHRGGLIAEIGRLAGKLGYSIERWAQHLENFGVNDVHALDDAQLESVAQELRETVATAQ